MAQDVPRTLNFAKNDYHAQNQNWSIAQLEDGEMAFGNSAGLIRFDGAVWSTMALPNKQIIRSVTTDVRGKVYVGGFAEFGFFEKNALGNFEYTPLSTNIKFEKIKHEEIWHILVTPQAVYFQSFSTIYKYDFHDVTVLSPPDNVMFLHSVNGRLILPVINKGLYELTANNDFFFIEGSAFLSKKIVSTILPYNNNGLLIGTARDGIFVFENNTFKPWAEGTQTLSRNYQMNKGILLSNGNYAFGTILDGVYVLRPDGSTVFHINKENGLQNNTVLALHEDRAKNLWVGLDKGIDLIDLTSPVTFFQDRSGKIGSVYTAAVFNGKLYVGTNQGLFFKTEHSTQNFTLLNGTQGQVWNLLVIDNQLLIGHNTGSFILNANNELTKFSDVTGGWCVIPFDAETLLQGTYTGIAVLKKNKQGEWSVLKKISNFGEPVKKIALDSLGYLWALNAYHQLFRLKINSNFENTEAASLMKIGNSVKYDLSKIGNDLFFKADDNYFVFENDKMDFKQAGNKNFENTKIYSGTNNDLVKVHTDFVEIQKNNSIYTRFHLKLISDYETVVVLDSSRYLFGLDDGYAIFDKKDVIPKSNCLPKAIIRLFAKDGAVFNFYPSDSARELLHLPPQYRALRIEASLPFFTDEPRFSYFLSQYSSNWSPWESTNSHEFANLSAGKHTFRLRNDITGEEIAIEFDIQPHWYETILAKIAYLLAFICFVFLLLKFHKIHLENQRLHLEADILRESEQQRIRADNERLHHDIINKSQELANSTMGIIRKNEILIEIKDELDNIKTEQGLKFPEKYYHKLRQMIEDNLSNEENWRVFEENFNEVHENFLKRLKNEYTELTPGDLKLAAYLRMNLTSKEISPLLYISTRSVENKRYRLRKKLNLRDTDNLTEFILKY